MKKTITFFIALIWMISAIGTEWVSIHSNVPKAAEVQLITSDVSSSEVEFIVDGFFMNKVKTPKGNAYTIGVEEGTPLLMEGEPDVAKLTVSLLIPDMDKMDFEVISSEYQDYFNIEIAPSKGNLTRDINPDDVEYSYGKTYEMDQFYPGKPAALRNPYIIRDYRGQTLIVYPFQYNPVQKTLRVYHNIKIRVKSVGKNGINPLIRQKELSSIDTEFSNIYANHFLNYDNTDYTPVGEQGNMLVISYGSFMTDMQPFVDWKNTIGIPTEMIDVATIGSSSSAIKTYIANYYNTNGLTFVLLVGDAAQVPSSYASGDSDNDYSYVVGSDHYPDLFVGRFSAENTSHVQTQVQRTIDYEQNPTTGYDWYTRSTGIASQEGTGDDNEYDFEHVRNMQTDLLGYTYTWNAEFFEGSQGGNDASGNPTAAMVASEINNGTDIIVYTGHGSNTSFVTSGFNNTNVNALTNNGKLPFIWSVACVNGNFVGTTCFAEAWMRATNNNEPSGSVATLMSTINQSWNPPMEGQDEMVDLLVESYAGNIKRTFGGLSMNGCMKMNDTYGSAGDEMTDTWNCFGDPSLMVRTAFPQTMTANHNPVILLGSTQFTVNCDTEGALVCLTIDNQIIGTAYVSGGSATVNFDALTNIETVTIAITAYNYIPYLGTADIVPASGPYVSLFDYQINDVSGNNNGQADFGENITLNVELENVGSSPASNVSAVLSTTNPHVLITDNTQAWGTINDGTTSIQNNAFAIVIANNIPDQTIVSFNLDVTGDSDDIWNATFSITVNAPFLEFGNMTIDDGPGGNGRLDPGETADITVPVENNGQCNSTAASAMLSSVSSYITVNSGSASLGVIGAGGFANAIFNITCDALTPIGTSVDLTVDVDAGEYHISNTFYQSIGLVLEDWETGTFYSFPWTFAGSADWTITTADPYEGAYCAQSGVITHNQTSELVMNVETTNDDYISFYCKVSSEGSYDYLRFYIDGTQQEQWSGEVAWGQVSYFVAAGVHEFKWEYSKDGSVSSGSDCGWVDYIVFPSIVPPPAPPDIDLSDLSFEVTVPPGGNTTEVLTIANLGEADLDFSLSKYYITDAAKAYCVSSGGGADEFIQNVSIGTINNTTAQSYYADYSAISTVVNVGESYPITITNGDPNWATDECGIWVDWNQNEDFSDDAPVVVTGTPGVGPYTATITPPVDAMPGLARMRVQILYAATPDPCLASFSYGEVEDYSLNVNSNFVDWLTIDPMAGTIGDGGSTDIDFTFDATDLTEGDYYVDVTVTSNDPDQPSIVIPCTMHVAVGNTISGTISYPNSGTPLNNCTVMLYNDADVLIGQTNTNASGYYELTAVANGNYSMVATCSMPYTYVTTLSDLNIVVSHLLGIPVTGLYFLAAEVSGDGGVGLDDYNLMGSNLLGTLVGYPAVPDFRFEDQNITVSGGNVTKDFGGIMSGDATGDGM